MRYRVAPAVLAAALLSCLPISDASAEDLVPDVVGLELGQAQALLEQAGYPAQVDYDPSKPAGRVFGQTPGGLSSRPKGTRVTLEVGGTRPAPDTPEPVPVPVVVPERPADDLGTPPGGTPPPDPLDLGDPPTKAPGPDTPMPDAPTPDAPTPDAPMPDAPMPDQPTAPAADGTGDAILDGLPFAPRLDRNGPEIPDTLGQTRAAALNALRSWAVREEFTLSVPSLVGTVINQWPMPGMTLAAGQSVTIQIAVAESPSIRHRSVPALRGKSLAEIEAALQRFGFRGELRKVVSRSAGYGRAVWQQPLAGSLALEGSPVLVNVGIGDGAGPVLPTDPPTAPTQPAAPEQPAAPIQPPTPPVDPNAPPAGIPPLPPLDPAPAQPREAPTPPAPVDPPSPRQPDPLAPTPRQPDPSPPDPIPPGMRTPLVRPTLISPPAGESYPRAYGATFEWTAVKGAGAYEWELEEEQPSGAWRKVETATVKNTRHRPDRMKRGRYRWRVRATAGQRTGDWSGWSRLYMY